MEGAATPEAAIGKKSADLERESGYVFASIPSISLLEPRFVPGKGGKSRWEKFHATRTTAYAEVMKDAIKYSIDYVKGQSFLESSYSVNITKEGASFKIDVQIKEDQKALNDRSEAIMDKENHLWAFVKHYYARAHRIMPVITIRRYNERIGYNSLAIDFGYGINKSIGSLLKSPVVKEKWKSAKKEYHRHSWDIIAYVKLSSVRLDKRLDAYNAADVQILTGPEAGDFMGKRASVQDNDDAWVFTDMVCSRCFYVHSTAEEDIKDIKKFSERDLEMINFYRFFEFQCPKPSKEYQARGERSHAFREGTNDICKNCGFKKAFAADRNLEYYKKYVSDYHKERKKSKEQPVSESAKTHSVRTPISKVISSWKPKPGVVNELSDATYDIVHGGSTLSNGLKPLRITKKEYLNLLNNVGLTERIEYDDIIKGVESPYKEITPEMASARIERLNALINEIIYDYTAMLNYDNISKPGMHVKDLMESASPSDMSSLKKFPSVDALTPLNMNYMQAYREAYIIHKGDPIIMAQFNLFYFCTLLMGIVRVARKEKLTKTFAKEIVLYFLVSVINGEKTFASAKAARLAALQASQKVSVEDDDNMVDNRQTRMFDEIIDPEYIDKFDFGEMDYDGYNDDINT
jgi:hypothetical protein